jgi:hypothetical protein
MKSLHEVYKELSIPEDSNLSKQWYMYANPAGEVNWKVPPQQYQGSNVRGGYNLKDQTVFVQNAGDPLENADTFSHEMGHQNIHQRKAELGHPDSFYMEGTHPENPNLGHLEFPSQVRGIVKESLLSRHPDLRVGKRADGSGREGFYGSFSRDKDYPSNMISSDEEVIAGLRGLHGREKGGSSFWDTDDGQVIRKKLLEKYSPEYIDRNLDKLMFPLNRFARESLPESLMDRFKAYFTYPSRTIRSLFK